MDAAQPYPTLHVSAHPLVAHKLAILRDTGTDTKKFRELVRELTWLLGYEAMADLATGSRRVQTPLEETDGAEVEPKVGLVPVLRAGLGMVDAMLELIPTAEVWHIGLYRDERTLKPVEYYNKLPDAATVQVCLILDPMLATGGSAAATVDILKAWGAARIKQVSLIAAPEGVATLSGAHPDVDIHVAAVDRELNERGYIVPGLGDAGDRQFGTFAGPASEPGHAAGDETAEVVRRLQRDLAGRSVGPCGVFGQRNVPKEPPSDLMQSPPLAAPSGQPENTVRAAAGTSPLIPELRPAAPSYPRSIPRVDIDPRLTRPCGSLNRRRCRCRCR